MCGNPGVFVNRGSEVKEILRKISLLDLCNH